MRDNVHYIETDQSFDSARDFLKEVPNLVEKARNAAQTTAVSYRGVHVGAAGVAATPPSSSYGVEVGANVKPNTHTTTVCAEKVMLKAAKKKGFTVVSGIVVASSVDLEEIASIVEAAPPTLPPCQPCSNYFDESPLMRDDTVILSVPLETDRWQVRLHGGLRSIYLSGRLKQLEEEPVRFGFDDWHKKVEVYDHLFAANNVTPEQGRRPAGELVRLAMLSMPQVTSY